MPVSDCTTFASLSPTRRRLLRLMQQLNFGRIEGLSIRRGEPVFDPMPKIVVEHKFAAENGPRPEASRSDFALKHQHLDLFRLFDRLGDQDFTMLRVLHGTPFSCEHDAVEW